jgi:hypothetical protein
LHAAWFGTSILDPYILTTSILEPTGDVFGTVYFPIPRLPAAMTKLSFRVSHTVLLWFCVMVMLRFLSRAPVFLAFPPPPPLLLFALNLPCRLAAVADALLDMVNSDLLLLHLLEVSQDANVISSNEMNNSDECLSMARSPARPFMLKVPRFDSERLP